MDNGKEEFQNFEVSGKQGVQTDTTVTVPVIEEFLSVGKKVIETARVTISKTINEKTETFEIPLQHEEIVVKRVPKNELVETMPAASRYEGDVMIIPVLKEVAILEKRMMLVEEIHISRLYSEKTETQEVTVRQEEVNVTRIELQNTGFNNL